MPWACDIHAEVRLLQSASVEKAQKMLEIQTKTYVST